MQIPQLPDIPEVLVADFESRPEHHLMAHTPFVVRGLAEGWPLCRHNTNDIDFVDLLNNSNNDIPVSYFELPASANGRIFYNDDFSGFNFSHHQSAFSEFANKLLDETSCCYMGSTPLSFAFPALIPMINAPWAPADAIINLWVGNACTVSAHYDVLQNLAVNITGERTFTLFPPEAIRDLYPGPVHKAPGGQAISLVNFSNIDEQQFPRFKYALKTATTTTLTAGDAIFIPSLWWHHVQSAKPLNTLLNFWYRHDATPVHQPRPMDALFLTLAAVRDLPDAQKKGWMEIFKYYVFEHDEADTAHIPPSARERLTHPLPEDMQKQLRTLVTNNLKR
ncbi:cupin-like domain-containing protein [Aestuariibacter sp. A3R04]|uniref:cupin-like domain-containing protein n=1 Tax=Aestuariibacter sp. A3R04 TaxID=2841571 RepID=UPI001C087820|nr:cupin-like domain-containing protein [Aestuariibacter sp. A3R04]MBU3020717.1 cupin-like domain-containing protein [Aestuariibacter sp. A3R04]